MPELYDLINLKNLIIYGQMVQGDLIHTGKAGSFLHGFIMTGD